MSQTKGGDEVFSETGASTSVLLFQGGTGRQVRQVSLMSVKRASELSCMTDFDARPPSLPYIPIQPKAEIVAECGHDVDLAGSNESLETSPFRQMEFCGKVLPRSILHVALAAPGEAESCSAPALDTARCEDLAVGVRYSPGSGDGSVSGGS